MNKSRQKHFIAPWRGRAAFVTNLLIWGADSKIDTRRFAQRRSAAFGIAFAIVLCALSTTVNAGEGLELYVDTATKQVFTEPGPNRVRLGSFVRIDETAEAPHSESALTAASGPQSSTTSNDPNHGSVADTAPIAMPGDTRIPPKRVAEEIQPTSAQNHEDTLTAGYGKKGFEVRTSDGRYALAIQNRLQFRYANPFDRDPRTVAALQQDKSSFMVRRARTKLAGNAFWPWLSFYLQYDWSQPVLRDFYLNLGKFESAQLRVGRGKVLFNDERVTSSGKQQFVNRSIVNDIFTVDRQQGIQVFGRLFADSHFDLSYAVGVFAGLGVGERENDDDNMMWSGRLQWNALGGEMSFSQGDVEYHEQPALNFAFAAATNKSACTAFETDNRSCRALPGFVVGLPGQYRVNQMMEETRFKWRGFSFQQELHWKEVRDTLLQRGVAGRTVDLLGLYAQAGYFPHFAWSAFPQNLEFAGRYAFVDPDVDVGNNLQEEFSGVMTYYLNGHANKLNFQVSHLVVEDPLLSIRDSDRRYWVQWDISF
ncbi:MAG: porin [Gammaproteobacteria bacterium]